METATTSHNFNGYHMTKLIHFSKMHGLGNDFVVVERISQAFSREKDFAKKFSDRYRGIGFDQLLVIDSSSHADFACRIFNADGSEAEQCGNGMRCVARFIQEKKLSPKKSLTLETKAGIIETTIQDFDSIIVNMGPPQLNGTCDLKIDNNLIALTLISMGNPHAVISVTSVNDFPVVPLGHAISTHSTFPKGVNVGFMQIINRDHIRLRTFERGAGETCACGTNSCAAVVAGISNGLLDKKVKVELAHGHLWIEWDGEKQPVMMTGPAAWVFDGTITVGLF